jgi:hypothetical protein
VNFMTFGNYEHVYCFDLISLRYDVLTDNIIKRRPLYVIGSGTNLGLPVKGSVDRKIVHLVVQDYSG